MKSFTHVALPILVVVGLIFGVTWLSNYTPSNLGEDDLVDPNTQPTPLVFGAVIAKQDPETWFLRNFQSDYELGEAGHYDFWFQNRNDEPVTISVDTTSCSCSSIDIGILESDPWRDYLRRSAVFSSLRLAFPSTAHSGSSGPAALGVGPMIAESASLAALLAPSENIRWAKLMVEDNDDEDGELQVKVPAASARFGPQPGIVRLNWDTTKSVGETRLTAGLFMSLPDRQPRYINLEVNIVGVPPIRVWPHDLELGVIAANEKRSKSFVCFSTTRPLEAFPVEVEMTRPHQCLILSEGTPLTEAEIDKLETELEPPISPVRPNITAAVRFTLTAYENYEGYQMDLGPIDRSITISLQNERGRITYPVEGRVRGEVRVIGGGEGDIIDLGKSFPRSAGKSKTVRLTTRNTNLEMTLSEEDVTPNFLKASLKPLGAQGGEKEWELRVEVPPNTLAGALPEGSGLFLEITDTQTGNQRRIRIPVEGQTYEGASGPF